MSWWRLCSDVSLLCCTNDDIEEDKIVVGRGSPSMSRKANVCSSSKRDSDKTLTLIRSDVAIAVLRDFFGYNPKREDASIWKGLLCRLLGLKSGLQLW